MCREIVGNDVDFSPFADGPQSQKERRRTLRWCAARQSCRRPRPSRCSMPHTTTKSRDGNIQNRAVLRGRVTMAKQDQAIQGLNGCFLIHTEYGRMLRRIHVQANDVCRLFLQIRDHWMRCNVQSDVASAEL